MNARWYVVQSKARSEPLAERNLVRQGYTTFLPREVATRRRRNRLTREYAAVFPGYIFVNIDFQQQRWTPINSTYGVSRIIRFGEGPTPAPPGLVEGLLALTNAEGLIEQKPQLCAGDRVRIARGPFADFFAKVVSLNGTDRVRVLFDIMQSQVPVEVAITDCERTNAA